MEKSQPGDRTIRGEENWFGARLSALEDERKEEGGKTVVGSRDHAG
jgi:hypothetical protein